MGRDAVSPAFKLAIAAPGTASFEWIADHPAGTRLKIFVTGGQIALTGDSNAYLTAVKLSA
jgi:hypothetical protein